MHKLFLSLLVIALCQTISAQDTLLLLTGRKLVVASVDLSNNTIAFRKMGKLKTINPERVFSVIYNDGKERVIYQPDSLDPIDFKVEEMRNFIRGEIDARDLYKNNIIKIAGIGIGGGAAILGFYGLVGPPVYATVIGSYSPNIEKKLSFKVSGNAAGELGIPDGNYLNHVTGTKTSPVVKKDQELKICNYSLRFNYDAGLDSVVATINSKFKCLRVHAANDDGKIRLFKSNFPNLLTDNPYREGFEKKVRDYKIRNGMISGLIGFFAGALVYNAVF